MPTWFIIFILLSFTWLGYETDWLRVRLPYGVSNPAIKQPDRKWQFLKYGDDSLMLCQHCDYVSRLHNWRSCGKDEERWFAWKIPAQSVKVYGSTINFKAGCNQHRAKLLKDIIKAQKSKATATYKPKYDRAATLPGWHYTALPEPTLDILINGDLQFSVNSNHKRGAIKQFMSRFPKEIIK